MKIKILMLPNNTYPTSHAVLEEVFTNILHNRGHEITWVMQSSEKLKKNKIVSWKGTKVHVTMAFPGTSRFGRLINHVLRCIGKILIIYKNIKNENFDIVQVREGIIEGLLAVYLKNRYGIPFSFQYTYPRPGADIYTFKKGIARYPLIYYIRGMISKPILIWIMSKADLVLPVSRQMEQDLIKEGIPKEKMMTFPLGANISISPSLSGREVKEKYKLSSSSTIIYVGTMTKSRNLSFLLHVIARIKEKIPNITLLMVGDGNDRESLEKLSKDLGIQNNVIFTGQIPRDQVPEFISAANIGVHPLNPLPIHIVLSPMKLMEYMAMAKPVVGTDIPEIKKVIRDSGGGICVRYDKKAFSEAIIELLNNPDKAKEMGKFGRRYIEENRSYKILADKLELKYLEIIKTTRSYQWLK